MAKTLPGINIQWPWSQLIAEGKKTVETRTYPIPEKFRGKPLALIETPGPKKNLNLFPELTGRPEKARIIAIVTFEDDYLFTTEHKWRIHKKYHCVPTDNPQFKWSPNKEKWGWKVGKIKKLSSPKPAPKKRGIVFAKGCKV